MADKEEAQEKIANLTAETAAGRQIGGSGTGFEGDVGGPIPGEDVLPNAARDPFQIDTSLGDESTGSNPVNVDE